jgi:hypothetical protein
MRFKILWEAYSWPAVSPGNMWFSNAPQIIIITARV